MSNILWTKVKFARNLKGVKFAPRMTDVECQDLLNLCLDATNACGLKGGALSQLSKSVIDNLQATENITPTFVNNDLKYKGIANNNNVNVEIGGRNHVVISAKNEDVFSAYSKAKQVDKKLCNKLNFAYSDKYGFLSPDIRNIGSGMSVEAKILLPALNKLNAIKSLPKSNEKLIFNIERLDEETGLCLISSGASLGYTEKQICELSSSYIDNIIKCEIEASKTLAKQDVDEVLDANARAKAILKNCVKIEAGEVYSLIGSILIAINAELEKDITTEQINKILNHININKNNYKKLAQEIQKILK